MSPTESELWETRGNNYGRVTGVRCPRGDGEVIYNANYFCENLGSSCDWALPHPATRKADRAVCDQLGIDYY